MSVALKPKLVRASAGTGKTYELSSRYIALLAAGEKPERILATTFTRKAAYEIRQRVFLRLASAAAEKKEAAKLGEAIGNPKLSCTDAAKILGRLVREQHRLNISTLDSLFHSIASSFALELGLIPGWRMDDPALEEEAQRQAIRALCQDEYLDLLCDLMPQLNRGEFRAAVHGQIFRQVQELHQIFRESGPDAWRWIPPATLLDDAQLNEIGSAIQGLPIPTTKSGSNDKNWEKAHGELCSMLRTQSWEEMVSKGVCLKLVENESSFQRQEIPEVWKRTLDPLVRHAAGVLLSRLRAQTEAIYGLLTIFDREFERHRAATRTMGFGDVKLKLSRASVTGELAELYYRLDCRISHLLLDEFQDTSLAEWQVLEPVADELLSKGEGEHSFFCVGDVKQAIYGWRGGVAEIFDTLEERWPHLDANTRETSRRSAPEVITAVNKVFSNIQENPALANYKQASAAWGTRFRPHESLATDRMGHVTLHEASYYDAEDSARPTFRDAAKCIRSLVERSGSIEIGVLVRRKSSITRMIEELAELGVRASEEGGNPLTDSLAVRVVLSLLTLTDHPGDTISRFHVAGSPLGAALELTNIEDNLAVSKLARSWKRKLLTQGFGVTLTELTGHLIPHCDERDRRRLSQLVEAGFAFDGQRGLRTSDFIRRVEYQQVEDPSSAQVRVMTIHRSKGLEFDAVVLPELDFALLQHEPVLTYRSHPLAPAERVSRNPTDAVRKLEPRLQEMYQQVTEGRLKEAFSVLYVALTRARHALHMFIQMRSNEPKLGVPTFGAILRGALSGGSKQHLYEDGSDEWLERVQGAPATVDAGEGTETAPIQLAEIPPHRRRFLPHQSPSRLDTAADDTVTMSVIDIEAQQRGTLLHRLYELMEWSDAPLTRDAMRSALAAARERLPMTEELLTEFLKSLSGSAVRHALSREAYADWEVDALEVLRECPFAFRHGGVILTGKFDRLVIGRKNGRPIRAEVLDFKSESLDPKARAVRVRHYSSQMESYRKAAAKFCRIDPKNVSTKLLFVSMDDVELIEPKEEEQEEKVVAHGDPVF